MEMGVLRSQRRGFTPFSALPHEGRGIAPAKPETGSGFARTSHLIASGLVGEPTAPVIGIAGATNMNS